ncbi:hypothetical protein, partial [Anaerotignum sp.]
MKKRRLLAWLMTLVMMIGLMPATALANGETEPLENLQSNAVNQVSGVADLKKEVTDNGNGTYTVNLSVEAKQPVRTQPLEIVFVIDSSSSMKQCTQENVDASHGHNGGSCNLVNSGRLPSRMDVVKEKVCTLITTVAAKDPTAKVAIVSFNGGNDYNNDGYGDNSNAAKNESNGLVTLNSTGVNDLTRENGIVDSISTANGTYPASGLAMAKTILDGGNANAKKVVILLGDGDAGYMPSQPSATAKQVAIDVAATLKSSTDT